MAAVVVETDQAPPAIVFLHAEQCQIPTAVLLTESCSFLRTINQYSSIRKVDRSNLATEGTCVSRVLRDFHFFDLFTQGGTITLQ